MRKTKRKTSISFTKLTKFRAFRWWFRRRVSMPLANWLIGSNKIHTLRMVVDGVTYEAEFHRQQYWYELRPAITICGILKKRKTWHVTFWDKGAKPGWGGIEMLNNRKPIVYGTKKTVLPEIEEEMKHVIHYWTVVIPSRRLENNQCDAKE